LNCKAYYDMTLTSMNLGHFVWRPPSAVFCETGLLCPLAAKVFDLLLFLVQNKEHLITKEELMAGVWHGKLVEDNSLTVAMSALRKALEETRSEQYIETVPKRGYRFTAVIAVKGAQF